MDIAVDFDGVIVEERWPEIGPVFSYGIVAMRRIHSAGHRIIINTCREGALQDGVRAFLDLYAIPYDLINENFPDRIGRYGGDCRKISADLYIDDRNIGGFPGWIAVLVHLRLVDFELLREMQGNESTVAP